MAGFDQNFSEECIKYHNIYRERHKAPPLTHDPVLSKAAQKYAEELARIGKMQHSKDRKGVGENLGMKSGSFNGFSRLLLHYFLRFPF